MLIFPVVAFIAKRLLPLTTNKKYNVLNETQHLLNETQLYQTPT
jgi:hypothetical protein